MTLIAILALAIVLAVVWRLTRLAVKLLLLGALIALIAGRLVGATTHHASGAPRRSAPSGQQYRPPAPPERRDLIGPPAPGKPTAQTSRR